MKCFVVGGWVEIAPLFVCYNVRNSLVLCMYIGVMVDGVPHPVIVWKALGWTVVWRKKEPPCTRNYHIFWTKEMTFKLHATLSPLEEAYTGHFLDLEISNSACGRRLELDDVLGSCQPKTFCDSMIIFLNYELWSSFQGRVMQTVTEGSWEESNSHSFLSPL